MAERSEFEKLIIQEWLKRPDGRRKAIDVIQFRGYLERNQPGLLSFGGHDQHKILNSILQRYIEPDLP
jgi:hypothetical protein